MDKVGVCLGHAGRGGKVAGVDEDSALTGLESGGEKKVFKGRGLARREEVTTWLELGRRGSWRG